MVLKKNDQIIGEEPNLRRQLQDQTQFTLNKINKIKDYFIAEICEIEAISKELSKYITAFDYLTEHLLRYLQQVVEYLYVLLPR